MAVAFPAMSGESSRGSPSCFPRGNVTDAEGEVNSPRSRGV